MFLLGGIAAVVPSAIHDAQNLSLVRDLDAYLPLPNLDPSSIPGKLKGAAVQNLIALMKWNDRLCCGSSGGAYALLGSALVIYGSKFYHLIKSKFKNENTKVFRFRNKEKSFGSKVISLVEDHRFWSILYDTIYLGVFVLKELNMIYFTAPTSISVTELITKHNVGHSVHIQGCLFGFIWTGFHAARRGYFVSHQLYSAV